MSEETNQKIEILDAQLAFYYFTLAFINMID